MEKKERTVRTCFRDEFCPERGNIKKKTVKVSWESKVDGAERKNKTPERTFTGYCKDHKGNLHKKLWKGNQNKGFKMALRGVW